ncbi:MAG TPA: outer membrane protein transport protein [Thermoanaerobaculia bacterium]|nr:outer membrane protein transport protein [Thermoanaerobaculia bacterium]
MAALGVLAVVPVHAAGFSIFEQGTRAMGTAGAFTGQADDPSMLYHNAGGLAFVEKSDWMVGATYITSSEAEFEGAGAFPGPGYRAEQETLAEILPHAYYVTPINDRLKFGFGLYAPFGLTTSWENPDQFAGRFISTEAAIRSVDLNPTIGIQLTPNFGLGIGAIARVSDVDLNRNVGTTNPFTFRFVDVGRLNLETDFGEGYGWNVGILHRWNNSFSWGLSYRSNLTIDYEGDARLEQVSTGNAQLDQVIASRLPFNRDLPAEASIEFPDQASLGLSFALSPNLRLNTDFNYMGWSSFDTTEIDFVNNDLPDSEIVSRWDDVYSYRAGLSWTASPSTQWRLGYVYDETPQPEEAVSPLLPDANRDGITLGWGHSGNWRIDVALMYLMFEERTRARSFENEGDFFGTYNTTAWLFGLTVGR